MNPPSENRRANAHLTDGSAVFKTVDGRSEVIDGEGDVLRDLVIRRTADEARSIGSSVELVTTGDRGEHRLRVDPDGTVTTTDTSSTVTRTQLREQAWWISGPAPVATDAPSVAFPDLSDLAPANPAPAPERAATPPEDLIEDVPSIFELLSADEPEPEAADEPDAAESPATEESIVIDEATPIDEPPAADPAEPPATPEFSLPQPSPTSPYTGPQHVEQPASDPQPTRPSFITPAVGQPAPPTGWRGFLARIGIPVRPSRLQLERAGWEQEVSLQWAGCRTIAVANGKGGVGKTMTTAMLAAVFARHGGGNVLAWDNNDTRGTLGWRTEQGLYDTTIRDLLPEAERLLEPTSSVSEIARFVHHQATDRYDVLRSNPELLATDQRIATADFDLLMQVAARYYRLVIFDSGNDESADRWLRMIDSSYQLVVPTLAAPESAESAALLLDALRRRDEHSRRLADQATVIVSQSERSSLAAVSAIAEKFAGHVRAVEIIPFDSGLKSGPLRFDGLQSATRDAWVRAGAAVARGL